MKRTEMTRLRLLVPLACLFCGCASPPNDGSIAQVSRYASFDCPQIAAERSRIERRATLLAGRSDRDAANDKARLESEYAVLRTAALARQCEGATPFGATPIVTAIREPVVEVPAGRAPAVPRPAAPAATATTDDTQLVLGSRSLLLGGGRWLSFGRADDAVLASRAPAGPAGSSDAVAVAYSTSTAFERIDETLGRIVVVTADRQAVEGVTDWATAACAVPEALLHENWPSPTGRPECLYVRAVDPELVTEPSRASPVFAWARNSGVGIPALYHEVFYARYASNGFMQVALFVPAGSSRAADDAAATARALADSIRPLAAKERTSARLPEWARSEFRLSRE